MNSLRYLVSRDKDRAISGNSPTRPPTARSVKQTRSTPIKRSRSERCHLIWHILAFIIGVFHISTPKMASQEQPHRKSKKQRTNSSSSSLPPIPRLFANRKRKTLVLDLDETLVHSMTRSHSRASQMVEVHLQNSPMASFYYVAKRPFCIDFLAAVLQWYDVAIFTASVCEYADPIIDLLERDIGWHCFKRRFYRDSCIPDGKGGFVKDLQIFEQDMSRILLIDNSPISFAHQRCNGLAIEGWISDPSDRALLQLLPLLFALRHTSDVRSILSLHDGSLIRGN